MGVSHSPMYLKLQESWSKVSHAAREESHNLSVKNRKQFCYVEGQKSPANEIGYGIPQGSCLGPLLFIIYTNDFERCLQGATPNMYADDTSITCFSSDSASLQRNIDIEMTNVAEWMRQNRLSLNANESEVMGVSHSRHHNNLNEL